MEPRTINGKYKPFCTNKCLKEAIDGKLQCNCGEDTAVFDWLWQDQQSINIRTSNEGKEVLFHPVYSSGTAAVRGQLPFQQNYHYYWEIKMISKLYGTDVMIGVGTSKVAFEDWQYKFCSLLGIDSESWGYSYHGNIQHNLLRRKYGMPFGLGSIVGIHLDMCSGTLEYFLNRVPLGIAFKDLKGKELYPMVCSTAAQLCMRVTCCISKEATLQMMCLKRIMDHPGLYKKYKDIPGLSKIYEKQLLWMQPQVPKDVDEKRRLAELDEDVALSLVDKSYLVKNKRLRAVRLISFLYGHDLAQDDDSIDVYRLFTDVVPSIIGNSSTNSSSSDRADGSSGLSFCAECHSTSHETEDCSKLL